MQISKITSLAPSNNTGKVSFGCKKPDCSNYDCSSPLVIPGKNKTQDYYEGGNDKFEKKATCEPNGFVMPKGQHDGCNVICTEEGGSEIDFKNLKGKEAWEFGLED